ncbi:MAG: hypothetical protein ACI9VT_002542 [Psychroserpens sp.]|jgi:hypothetical protein
MSLKDDVKKIAVYIRDHWSIENSQQWLPCARNTIFFNSLAILPDSFLLKRSRLAALAVNVEHKVKNMINRKKCGVPI